ncbi:sarcoplasmic reticulum histidine-rich calcium-binding protein [Gopherus flavomarginatus]|uniref:sarcoplasmic reticulum histidine-rich calcium-binding protein n=1 Tax=Gopherus flavomarginatus TaxID=286002 RepID=UPI0021CC0A9B|nr:sarcoplasmic reticulum histidine-rich calcium-binding protein [Gopherus flavomarginatus]
MGDPAAVGGAINSLFGGRGGILYKGSEGPAGAGPGRHWLWGEAGQLGPSVKGAWGIRSSTAARLCPAPPWPPPTAWLLLGLLCTLQPPGVHGNHRHGDVEPPQQAQGQPHHHDDPGPGDGEPEGQPQYHGKEEQPHGRHGDVARPQQANGQPPPEAPGPGHYHHHGDIEPQGQPHFHGDRHDHHGDEKAQPHEAEDAPGPRRHDDEEDDAPGRRRHDTEEDEDEARWRPQPEEEEEDDGRPGHSEEEGDESEEEGDESEESVLRKPHGAEERRGRARQGEEDDEEEEEDGYQPGSVCQYCAFCKHCGECEKCPCQEGDTSEHCESCQYCQFCYVCPLLCETGCQPGGIMDQLSGALVQSVSSIFEHQEQ